MNKISIDEALKIIKSKGIAYVMEEDSLNYLKKNNEDVECMISDDLLVVINPNRDLTYVRVIPLHDTFDVDELLALARACARKVSILINIQSLTKEFAEALEEKLGQEFICERGLTDLLHNKEIFLEPSDRIRLLNTDDRDAFVACQREEIKYRPPLAVLFDVFINRRQGYILAAFDEERIIGYLSFNSIGDKVYDVDYIYVIPEMRKQGVGKELATAYAQYTKSNASYAYWSNAKNEASEKTALSCGFDLIRQVKIFTAK